MNAALDQEIDEHFAPPDHGIARSHYGGGSGARRIMPTMDCLCGHAVRGDTWEEAGEAFDRHIEEKEA